MKNLKKHFAAIAMALAVAVTAIAPVTAEAKPSYNEKFTAYRTDVRNAYTAYTDLWVGGLSKSDTIKMSSVKSTNTKSVALISLEKVYNGYETEYFSSGSKSHSSKSYGYYIKVSLLKPGKSTVSFKIGNKTYKTAVTVAKYENPLKTAKILGKNYADKLESQNAYKKLKAKSTQKNQTFTFEANKNWKINSVEVSKKEKAGEYSYPVSYTQQWSYSSAPKTKATCSVGTIEKGTYYVVSISMFNTKTGGYLYVYYYINYPYNN